jgi:DNA-binding GntR family transcriptional regulator
MQVPDENGRSNRPASPRATGGHGNRIVRTSSGEQIATHIRRMIFEGALRPGERVPQDTIAAEMGVSRIPLREALIVLEREGWVSIELYRGAFINALDEQSVHDHYELFGLIYGFAAKQAILRGSVDLAERLADIQKRFATTSDPIELQRLSILFHDSIVEAAASPRIEIILRAMSALVPGNFFAMVPDAVDVERRGLGAITRAVKRGEGEQASAEYVRMMRQVGNEVVQLFETQALFDVPEATA